MRIISKTHDYYDCVMKQACDRSIIFTREMKDCLPSPFTKTMGTIVEASDTRSFKNSLWTRDCNVRPILLFFCGRSIPMVAIELPLKSGNERKTFIYRTEDIPAGTPKRVIPFIHEWITNGVCDVSLSYERITTGRRKYRPSKSTTRRVDFAVRNAELTKYAIRNGIAYFAIEPNYDRKNWITHYPILKDWEFYKAMPAFDAFQQIQMFLTNELAQEKKMPMKPISDKLKAESHGFNKWSFRKEPST